MKRFLKGQKGFTLIELLVVVAILGILAAVAVPNLASYMNSGQLSAANTEAAAVQSSSDAYYAEKGKPASDSEALVDAGLFTGNIVGYYTIIQTGNKAGEITGITYGESGFEWGTPLPYQWNK